MKKKLLAMLTLSLLLALGMASAAWAADETVTVEPVVETWQADDEEWPSNDELFAGYVEQQLYGNDGIMPFSLNAGDTHFPADTPERAIYDIFKTRIINVAQSGGSTEINVTPEDLGVQETWTPNALGISGTVQLVNKTIEGKTVQTLPDDVQSALYEELGINDIRLIMEALRADCSCDLYWYGNRYGYGTALSYTMDSNNNVESITVTNINFKLVVAEAYRQNNSETTVNNTVADIATVKANAQKIVDDNSNKTTYEKLLAYKTAICDLVSYNQDAADPNKNTAYGNPWQIVYVFDGNPDTNVVCEGYAKALKYLCDLGGIDCYLVTGGMKGGTGEGAHMWNIVQLDGQNYLVDVTNSDTGSIGQNGGLFLNKPTSGDAANGYVFNINNTNISFAYDESTKALWGASGILNLADADYDPNNTVAVEEVTLNKANLELAVGGAEQLNATVAPAGAKYDKITWTSGNSAIATVDENGKVTAVAEGNTTITATAGGKSAACEVTVKAAAQNVPVTGVKLEQNTATLEVGGTLDLRYNIVPLGADNLNVTWSSSNPQIATVQAGILRVENEKEDIYDIVDYPIGKVTAVAPGKAVITVKTEDGGFTDSCEVTVTKPDVPVIKVTAVTLDKTAAELKQGETVTLKATVTPDDATNKQITWTTSDSKVATVDNAGKVTAVAAGKATITATAADGSGVKAECVVTVAMTATEQLDDILSKPDAKPADIEQAIIDMNKDELTEAVKGDNSAAVLDKIAKLEEKLGGTTVNSSNDGIKKEDVKIVGAKVNDVKAELQINAPLNDKIEVTAPENDTKFRFSMQLVNTETQKEVEVVVPVKVTLPIPVNADNIFRENTFKLWHNHDGQTVQVAAELSQNNGKWFATFTVDGFSDFIMTYAEWNKNDVYTITYDTQGGELVGGTSPDYVLKTEAKNYKLLNATKNGCTFTGWQHKDTKQVTAGGAVYEITADTDFTAVWKSSGGHSGSHGGGGSGATTPTKPGTTEKPGTTTTPGTSSGQSTVTSANINNKFADVQNNAWYSEAIAYVYNKGMMNGTDSGKFEPNAATTRAMLVTMLFRLEGEPAASAAKFSDVASGQWFSQAIAWSASVGVVNGYENGKFGPNDALTREQLAAVLYRFAQFKGMDVSAKGSLSSFSDSSTVSGWATEAMQWAVGAGIINGDNGALRPTGNATRAEVAMMIMRFLENA